MADTPTTKEAAAQAAERQAFLRAAADMGARRLDGYQTYRDGYSGEHAVVLSDRQRQYLERQGIPWAENFCETIVDWMVARMQVEGFTADLHTNTEGDSEDDTEEEAEQKLADLVTGWWQQDCMNEMQTIVHEETAVCADGFVITSWDSAKQRPCWTYNPPEMVKPVYSTDQPGMMEYAVKVWNSRLEGQPIRRMNLFYPDRIEKWFTWAKQGGDGEMWHAFIDPDDYDMVANQDAGPTAVPVWPIPWVEQDGTPLGIPVVHFRNKPDAKGWGRSELKGVIPQNHALEKMVQDLFDVLDYLGSPVPWATGVDGQFDATFVTGEWKTTTSDVAKFGVIAGADPAGILTAIQAQLQRLAARSQTPLHALVDTGTLPSGESLKAAEAPGVKKVKLRCEPHTNSWGACADWGIKLARVYGGMKLPKDATLKPTWESPETRNDQAEATTAGLLHDLGVSKYTLLSNLGFDPEQEAELRKAEAEEAMAQQEAQLSAGLLGAGAYRGAQDQPTRPDPAGTPPTVPASGSA